MTCSFKILKILQMATNEGKGIEGKKEHQYDNTEQDPLLQFTLTSNQIILSIITLII
jgi:hypothetical protein